VEIKCCYVMGEAVMSERELPPAFLNYRAKHRGCGASRYCRGRCYYCREFKACSAELVRRIEACASPAELVASGLKAYNEAEVEAVLKVCRVARGAA